MRRRAGLALAVVVALPAAAAADGIDSQLTSTTSANWHSDDGYGAIFERFNASASDGGWTLGARLDLASFPGADFVEDRYEDQVGLEKLYLRWAGKHLEVTAGDSYVSFGRGLALSVRKVDELGVDTTVRGAHLRWRGDDRSLALVAGVSNMNNLDEASGRRADDTQDLIAGIQGQVRTHGSHTLGAHGVLVAFRDPLMATAPDAPDQRYAERWISFGPTFEAPQLTPRLGVYAEAVGQHRGDELGYGAYGSATYRDGRAAWLFEAKGYRDLEVVRPHLEAQEFASVQYTQPPTLERVGQQLDHMPRNTLGVRARVDWARWQTLNLFASLALSRDYDGYPIQVDPDEPTFLMDATVSDPYAGIELRWQDARARARLSGGWRTVVADMTADRVRGDKHVELDLVQPVAARVALELHALHSERLYYHPPLIKEQYREGTLQVGLRWAPRFAFGAIYDYTTQAQQEREHYLSGAAEWRPNDRVLLRAQVGAARGGLKCVSGVCRELPPFEGVKLTATVRR